MPSGRPDPNATNRFHSSTAENDDLDDNQLDDEEENDQPLDLTVKRPDGGPSADGSLKSQKALLAAVPEDLALPARENGLAHPKKRSWLKVDEEDDSFPHEIEEWKKTFAVGLCG